jgi:serine O-acetyltransferase
LGDLIFAGFFSKTRLMNDSIEYYVGELLGSLTYHLQKQIARALRNAGNAEEEDAGTEANIKANIEANIEASMETSMEANIEAGIEEEAGYVTYAFLERIPQIRRVLATDVEAFYDGDPAAYNTDEIILSYPGMYAIMVSRLAHELHLLGVPLIPRMMTEYAHSRTGIDIHPGATIGHHFFADHGTGIVVGETTVIGNYVKIYQGVTLGALSTRGGQTLRGVKRHPTIKDHVTIYSGTSIFGGNTVIGEGVVIGSNAFITESVPEKTRVSVRSPELQIKEDAVICNVEFAQQEFWDYVI